MRVGNSFSFPLILLLILLSCLYFYSSYCTKDYKQKQASSQYVIDSLKSEIFCLQLQVNRYEVIIDNFIENNPDQKENWEREFRNVE